MTDDDPRSTYARTRARAEFAAAQRTAGTADLVARARTMPDGSVDLAWNRRTATQQRLRLGSLSGNHPALRTIANQLGKPAPKGNFYVITVATADEVDALLVTVPR